MSGLHAPYLQAGTEHAPYVSGAEIKGFNGVSVAVQPAAIANPTELATLLTAVPALIKVVKEYGLTK